LSAEVVLLVFLKSFLPKTPAERFFRGRIPASERMMQNVETVTIGQASVRVAAPQLADCDDPVLRQIIALSAGGLTEFENAGRLAGTYLLELICYRWEEQGGTEECWRRYENSLGITRSPHQTAEIDHPTVFEILRVWQFGAAYQARCCF
jgi:hypothetical protein